FERGDRVGLLAHNSVHFLEVFFGAAKAGVIVVPLSTRSTPHELRHVVADCSMKGLFFDPELEPVAKELQVAAWPVSHRVEAGTFVPVSARDEDIHCLLYTSGTTGKPKGVMIPRRQLLWNGYNTAVNWGLREDDVASVFTPMYHAGGLAVFLIPLFVTGGTIVLHRRFEPTEVWAHVVRERQTVIFGVPTIFKMLMDAPEFATADLSHVRWLISGGAPLPQYLIRAYQERGLAFKQGYGMTEVGVNCFTMTIEESFRKPGSIGRAMLFTRVKLADETGAEVAPGEVGEMWIRGPHLSSGYWANEQATREAYRDDGWFRTGDLARCDDEGFFFIAGRRKEMFISGGVNVFPAEIEAELVSHPAVSDAAVVAMPDETWGEVPVAFVVAPGAGAAELSEFLGQRLAKYKVPKQFVFLEALPRTPYGKVVKEDLRKQLGGG
ncbi:MAG: AMP-binding protein, partial [Thermoanaerobaculia bacterium]